MDKKERFMSYTIIYLLGIMGFIYGVGIFFQINGFNLTSILYVSMIGLVGLMISSGFLFISEMIIKINKQ